jgi:integrase/recombinase XerD
MRPDSNNARAPPGGIQDSSTESKPKKLAKRADILSRFRQDLRLRGRGACALQTYSVQMQLFRAWHGDALTHISQDDLKAYLGHLRAKKLKTASINQAFTSLSAFCDFLEAEGEIDANPVPPFKKRYLQQYKAGADRDERRCISVDEAARIIITALDSRKQAIIILLAKTGMRVNELAALDVEDIDIAKKELVLKPTPKRSNRALFFDDEAARLMARWLSVRESQGYPRDSGPLWTSFEYTRLCGRGIENIVANSSRLAGVGDPALGKDHITPHYFRVFFTTHLLRAGMPRHYVQELRGDSGGAAIDVYTRIDREELRCSYLAHVPRLGV